MTDVVISSAARTAIGSSGRSLMDVPPAELGAIAAREALSRAQILPAGAHGTDGCRGIALRLEAA